MTLLLQVRKLRLREGRHTGGWTLCSPASLSPGIPTPYSPGSPQFSQVLSYQNVPSPLLYQGAVSPRSPVSWA